MPFFFCFLIIIMWIWTPTNLRRQWKFLLKLISRVRGNHSMTMANKINTLNTSYARRIDCDPVLDIRLYIAQCYINFTKFVELQNVFTGKEIRNALGNWLWQFEASLKYENIGIGNCSAKEFCSYGRLLVVTY